MDGLEQFSHSQLDRTVTESQWVMLPGEVTRFPPGGRDNVKQCYLRAESLGKISSAPRRANRAFSEIDWQQDSVDASGCPLLPQDEEVPAERDGKQSDWQMAVVVAMCVSAMVLPKVGQFASPNQLTVEAGISSRTRSSVAHNGSPCCPKTGSPALSSAEGPGLRSVACTSHLVPNQGLAAPYGDRTSAGVWHSLCTYSSAMRTLSSDNLKTVRELLLAEKASLLREPRSILDALRQSGQPLYRRPGSTHSRSIRGSQLP